MSEFLTKLIFSAFPNCCKNPIFKALLEGMLQISDVMARDDLPYFFGT